MRTDAAAVPVAEAVPEVYTKRTARRISGKRGVVFLHKAQLVPVVLQVAYYYVYHGQFWVNFIACEVLRLKWVFSTTFPPLFPALDVTVSQYGG